MLARFILDSFPCGEGHIVPTRKRRHKAGAFHGYRWGEELNA
jgi:hypothetical protein